MTDNDLVRQYRGLADKVKQKASTLARVQPTSGTVNVLEQCAGTLRQAAAEIERLRAVLREIAEKKGLCIYRRDPDYGFREGSNKAFDECASIAQDALDTAEGEKET